MNSARQEIASLVVDNYEFLVSSQQVNTDVLQVTHEALNDSRQISTAIGGLANNEKVILDVQGQWKSTNQLLRAANQQQQLITSLLDAPALVTECVKSHLYNEVTLIIDLIQKGLTAAPADPTLQRLERDVERHLADSVDHIVIPRLSQRIVTDELFKIISFLRRLGVSQSSLSDIFLREKDNFLSQMWEETNTIKVPLTRALRCISIYKTYVSEVVLQYEVCLQQDEDELDLLRLFCVKHTKLFVTTFTESISNITSCTELPLIAEQWQTTSPVLTKMHIDVSCAVNASLLTRVKEIFSYHMEQTMTNYRTSSRNFSWRSVPVTSIDLSTGISQLTTPPTQLLHWTPLAYALNGVLGSFNYVRKCMEAGVQQHCAEWVVYLLHCIVGDLRSICERVASAPTENPDRPALENYVRCFLQLFYPYLVSRLQTVLSPANIAWVESQIREDISLLEEGYAKPQQLS